MWKPCQADATSRSDRSDVTFGKGNCDALEHIETFPVLETGIKHLWMATSLYSSIETYTEKTSTIIDEGTPTILSINTSAMPKLGCEEILK